MTGTYATAAEFLEDRRDHLSVHACEVVPGAWDVVARLAGTYFDRDVAMKVAEAFTRDLHHLLPEAEQLGGGDAA